MYIAFICYQESLSEGVKPLLEQLKSEYSDLNYYSMLHDRDIKDKSTGEIKKEHYHVVLDINFNNKSHTIYEKEKIEIENDKKNYEKKEKSKEDMDLDDEEDI